MELSFAGKKAIVTGAGKGIGRAIAKKLQECGAEVFAVSRTAADLASLQAEAPGIKTVEVDLSKWDEARQAVADLGPVDLLVNNAGISRLAPFLEMKREDLESVMNVNFNAVFNVSQVVAGAMVKAGRGGAIVNVSSTASQLALVEHTNYCASKAALDMLTKIMALELGPHKIRVNSVNPTVVMTEMGRYAWSDPAKSGPVLARIPLGKFVEIEDVVHATLFLLSDQAAMVNGTSLPVDGGLLCN